MAAVANFKVHRLELYNFKSYLGKVSIGPFDNFTCIVGPNGSGKSNVMDALSFVLGASAATLRSSKWDDFIHKKAKKRECSVTLIMKSDAGDEKTFTRSLANEKSDFRVDGIACSDKEFSNALRRLKLSSRLSTFLVFQHEVDAIAQKKAKDLTDLIEQVSGSAELKAQYDQCRKNMDDANRAMMEAAQEKRGAQAELVQLKLHKEEASRYSELQTKHVREMRDLAMAELFFVELQLHRKQNQIAEMDHKLKEMGDQGDDTIQLKKQYNELYKQHLEEQKKNRQLGAAVRDAKTAIERVKASAAHFTTKLARQKMQLNTATTHSTTRDTEVARLKEQLAKVSKAWDLDVAKWKEEDAKTNKFAAMSADDLASYQKLRRDADCATITERQSLDSFKRQREGVIESTKDVQLQLDRVDAATTDFESAMVVAQEKRGTIENRIQEMDVERKELQAKLDDARAVAMQSKLQRDEREKKIANIDAKLRELRFTKEENRHGSRVAEALESLKALFPGVRGKFTEVCTIKDKAYTVAATVGFGANMDAIIVDTTETAMNCVRYLKEQRIASLTFLPLNNVTGKVVTDDLRTIARAKPLIDLLQFSVEFEPAVRYAVGQTLVCDNLNDARHVAYGGKDRLKVVTKDGTALLKNGSMQGGLAAMQQRAAKWDEQEYNRLKKDREAVLAEGGDADSEGGEIRLQQRTRELQSRLEFIESNIKRLNEESAVLQKRLDGGAAERKKLADSKRKQEETLRGLKDKIAALDKEIADRTAVITAVEDKYFGDFQKRVGVKNIAELERELQRKEKARAEQRHQFEVVKHKLETAIEAESKKVGESSAVELEKAAKATEIELKTALQDQEKLKADLDKHTAAYDKVQAAMAKRAADLDALEAQIRDKGRARAQNANEVSTVRKQLNMLTSARESLRLQRQAIVRRCRMEDIDLPLVESTGKRSRDTDLAQGDTTSSAVLRTSEWFMPEDNAGDNKQASSSSGRPSTNRSAEIAIDFASIPKVVREVAKDAAKFAAYKKETETTIDDLVRQMDSLAPNLKATSHFQNTEQKVGVVSSTVEAAKERSQRALKEFTKVKEMRTARFMASFTSINKHVDAIYRELTIGTRLTDVHGSAYFALEDPDEPYRGGTRYHATPPTKRYMEMQQLSGGERTMAAMALLFAIHATSPTPFFVLDEVDAALDAGNVEKLAQYIRNHTGPNSQYIVVSLKEQLYHRADALLGVYKDTSRESSNVMSLDLTSLPAEA